MNTTNLLPHRSATHWLRLFCGVPIMAAGWGLILQQALGY